MASQASQAKFDIREDEEQYEKLQDCVDLLVAAGYFRARVKGITAFDKIVGGMVWCISICNYTVDVDLLYAENSTIGQKIALTERVVDVLRLLKCPHSIEPHQIQGLDFIHIFPVIQWLVKKAIEAREEQGDQLLAFLDYLHEQKSESDGPRSDLLSRLACLSSEGGAPRRLFRRNPAVVPSSLLQDVRYTLAEFANGSTASSHSEGAACNHGQDNECGELVGLEPTTASRSRATGRALKLLVDEEGIAHIASALAGSSATDSTPQFDEIVAQMEELHEEEQRLNDEMAEMEAAAEEERGALQEKEQLLQEYTSLHAKYTPTEKEELRRLLEEYGEAAAGETAFKRAANQEMESLQKELQQWRERAERGEGEGGGEREAELTALQGHLSAAREEAATASQAVSRLQRALDSVPSQVELAQYQKRFMELGNEIVSEHRRARQAFTEHNTMVDVRHFMRKEVDLLHSIEEIITKSRGDYRDGLNEKLQVVLRGMDTSIDQVVTQDRELEGRRDKLATELAYLKEKERLYHKTISQFKQECDRNEELRGEMKRLGMENLIDV